MIALNDLNNDREKTAWLIHLCQTKMNQRIRLPRKTKKLVKRYMIAFNLRHVILRKTEIFRTNDNHIFMIQI